MGTKLSYVLKLMFLCLPCIVFFFYPGISKHISTQSSTTRKILKNINTKVTMQRNKLKQKNNFP